MSCASRGPLVVFFFLLITTLSQAQSPAIWYFGEEAGIDFRTSPPQALSRPNFLTEEASAVFTDENDSLLFYANATTIWDKTHAVMLNGSGILGGNSSSQGATFVAKPGDCDTVYLFTMDDHNILSPKLRYTAISKSGNGGLGSVDPVQKNILLQNVVSEGIAVVRDASGDGYWLIVHGLNNNTFSSYHVTTAGINPTPVNTNIGTSQASNLLISVLRANHAGNKIAKSVAYGTTLEAFDFDPATGILSNVVTVANTSAYGLAFSPDDQQLYYTRIHNANQVRQYNFNTSVNTLLASYSSTLLYKTTALLESPSGEIYVAGQNQTFLSKIPFPNLPGTSAGYVNGITLATGTNSMVGLPNYPAFNFFLKGGFLGSDKSLCSEDTTIVLKIPPTIGYNYLWSTGDTTESITIDSSGTYFVTAISECDSITDTINILIAPPLDFTSMQDTCDGLTFSFSNTSISSSGAYWDFGDGNTSAAASPSHTYLSPGGYTVTLIDTSGSACHDSLSKFITASVQTTGFTISPDTCTPNVNFTSNYTGPTSYSWDFGDGTNSPLANPVHSYNTSGIYTVSLAVNNAGCVDTLSQQVSVFIGPTAQFNYVLDTCNQSVTFINTSSLAGAFQWSFGDGGNSASINPSHTYNQGGLYMATLIADSGTQCADTFTSGISIPIEPSASFSMTYDTCGSTVMFFNSSTSANTFLWDFGDGNTSSQYVPTHSYATSGNYTITLYATNSYSCVDSFSMQTNIFIGPDASFSFLLDTCTQTVQFNNSSNLSSSWQWNFGDGSSSSSAQNPQHPFTNSGIFNVTLIADPGTLCADTIDTAIGIVPLPTASFTAISDPCNGQVVLTNNSQDAGTYFWSFGDGNTSTLVNPSHIYSSSGNYMITLVSGSPHSCFDTISQLVSVFIGPTASFSYSIDSCNMTVQFNNSSLLSSAWEWNFGDGGQSLLNNPIHDFGLPGTYTITLIADPGTLCADTTTQTLVLDPVAVFVDLGPDITRCSELFLQLDAGPQTWPLIWSTGASSSTIEAKNSGIYWVTVSSGTCTDTDSILITRTAPPYVQIDGDTIFCPGETIMLSAHDSTPDLNYLWSTGDNGHSLAVVTGGLYWIEVSRAGCSHIDSILVLENPCSALLIMPNVFTPNEDGANDLFRAAHSENITSGEIVIFNRWGLQVGKADLFKGWDGKCGDGFCSEGTYYWMVDYNFTTTDGPQSARKNGVLTLLR